MIDLDNFTQAFDHYKNQAPFDHCVIDGFLPNNLAAVIESEFLDYHSSNWLTYNNEVQVKKQNNDWYLFQENTYRLFDYLNSPDFVNKLSKLVGTQLYSDPGLHSGGCHIHGVGGVLNAHLDYAMHPKLHKQRKLNIIIYVSQDLKEHHGGHLGLWRGSTQPEELVKEIAPVFNRAVIFDTTQNSWHGLSRPLIQPNGVYRKSLAVYYLEDTVKDFDSRSRALFSLTEKQQSTTNSTEPCPHLLVGYN